MKKIMNKINFAIIAMMVSGSAFAARASRTPIDIGTGNGICDLLENLHEVFNILRIMAFIGAAFYIASWAWGYIKGGKAELDDVKTKGIGLLVGFSALFLIGIVLSFVMSAAGLKVLGCNDILIKW